LSAQLITLLALAAVLMFWAVGAHNRLVALRNAIGESWAKVDEALRQRGAAADALTAALREPLAAEAGALDTWQAALAEAARAAATMSARPVAPNHAAAWVACEAAVAAAASRVFALLEQQADLRQQAPVDASVSAWGEARTRLGFARQLFNEAALKYNDAIAAFPTRLLVGLFRFGAAGRL
jgi:LemA protein